MDQNALQRFAADLKKQRLEKKITLEEISSKTRIDIKFLSAIESADFDVLPEVYIKAFIKEYAKFIDLSPDSVLKKFDLSRQGIVDEEVERESETNETGPDVKREFDSSPEVYSSSEVNETNKKNNMILIISAAAFVVLLILLFTIFGGNDNKIITERNNTNSNKITSESTTNIPEVQKKNVPAATSINNDILKLKINASDSSWVKIIKDESTAEEVLMTPNSVKNVEAGKNFYLLVGNAAAIKLELNSQKLNFHGDTNKVKSVFIDKNGLKYILTKEIPGYNEDTTN